MPTTEATYSGAMLGYDQVQRAVKAEELQRVSGGRLELLDQLHIPIQSVHTNEK